MRRSQRPIIIAARRSPLARAQAEWVGAELHRLHPKLALEFRFAESEGDKRSQAALADVGGKGLFAQGIEQFLLEGRADIAVHSLKDLTTQITPGLTLAAIPPREDVRDCLIAADGVNSIDKLPPKAVVGTASPRRAAQILALRPDVQIKLLRGNIETRMRRVLDEHAFDATLLAVAGLNRGNLSQHARYPLDLDTMLPAASQGALAVQCRADDHVTLARCLPLNDSNSAQAVHAEREVVKELQGDCDSPIAVLAQPVEIDGHSGYRLRARVYSPDGQQCAKADFRAVAKDLPRLARQVLESLLRQDCRRILDLSRHKIR